MKKRPFTQRALLYLGFAKNPHEKEAVPQQHIFLFFFRHFGFLAFYGFCYIAFCGFSMQVNIREKHY
jgi:hypothetical protein